MIGGSFAGLSAVMQIARTRRAVCVIDAGHPRNRFAGASHGFFGQDGYAPSAMIARASTQVERYPTVRSISGTAVNAPAVDGGFEVSVGSEVLNATKLVLAYGISDELPGLPGLAERWGKSVLHCPYCHGYEHAGRQLGVLQTMPLSSHQACLIADWGPTTLYLNGGDMPDATFSLRLSYGKVAGWTYNGTTIPAYTYMGGLFDRANGQEPFDAPAKFLAAEDRIDPKKVYEG